MNPLKAFTVSFLFLLVIKAPTQERSHEITINYGVLCSDHMKLGCESFMRNIFSDIFHSESSSRTCFTGPVGISFQTRVNNFGYGTSFYYSEGRITDTDYDLKSSYYNFFYDLKYYWPTQKSFSISTGIGVGLTLKRAKEWDINVSPKCKEKSGIGSAYQFDLLSVKFGRTLTFSMDLGYGRKGLVRVGLGYQFL